ncbi:MAG: hypothetical protein ISN29_10915 [Gammaproteobacteria bacterium AqS3]|nr:hypothetical protein [Gammaproteobacteria bacterium AqS3]
MPEQGVLPFEGGARFRLETFCFPTQRPSVRELIESGDSAVYFWGASGCGCTHLLRGSQWEYLDLGRDADRAGLPAMPFAPLGLDNLDSLRGDIEIQQHLAERVDIHRQRGVGLLLAGHAPPMQVLDLPDAATRLAAMTVIRLQHIDDAERAEALRARARFYQMTLSEEVIGYLLARMARDNRSLMDGFDRLCRISLAERAPLSLHLVRRCWEAIQGQSSHQR